MTDDSREGTEDPSEGDGDEGEQTETEGTEREAPRARPITSMGYRSKSGGTK